MGSNELNLNLGDVGVFGRNVIERPDASGPLGRVESLPQSRTEKLKKQKKLKAKIIKKY